MTETHTMPVEDLEELLADEIPCGGPISPTGSRHTCTRAAVLISRGHGCKDRPGFACVQCWQDWYKRITRKIHRRDYVECNTCHQHFATVEAFSDYRPF